MHMVTIEDLMPQEHFLQRPEAAMDLSFVYEETAPLYSKKYDRSPIDPVVIVKYLLLGFLYGITSERQIERRVQMDIALRWYLGLDLFDRVPDHSTISQLRRRKPSFRKVFRRLFEEVVRQCVETGRCRGWCRRYHGEDRRAHVRLCHQRSEHGQRLLGLSLGDGRLTGEEYGLYCVRTGLERGAGASLIDDYDFGTVKLVLLANRSEVRPAFNICGYVVAVAVVG